MSTEAGQPVRALTFSQKIYRSFVYRRSAKLVLKPFGDHNPEAGASSVVNSLLFAQEIRPFPLRGEAPASPATFRKCQENILLPTVAEALACTQALQR